MNRALCSLRARRDAARARGESGDTLIEVLFAVIVLGIASVALLIAFATSISASAAHRSLATYDTVIRSASEQAISQIQQQTTPQALYESCAPTTYYQPGGTGALSFTLPVGYSAEVSAVQYWNGTTFTTDITQCEVNTPQLITVTTVGPDDTTYNDSFIVDDPFAPPVSAAGKAYKLVFAQDPNGATVNTPFTTQPVVRVEDQNGNLVTSDLTPVVLTILPNTGTPGANLSSYCTGVETSGVITFSGCSIDTAGLGYQLEASVLDPTPEDDLYPAISDPPGFNVYIQLTQPVITAAVPSTTTQGAIAVTFTGSTNAPPGQTYTATACANSGVGFGCVSQTPFVSGSQITGLTPGTSYYVTITANALTSLYLPATSATAGPTPATVQLNAPGTPSLAFGTVPGSVAVSFATPTPAAVGQIYTATACTNAAMTTGCVTGSVNPGGNLTGLAYSKGSPGSTYYVDIVAAASTGFLVSPVSAVSSPHAAVSQLNTPTSFSTASSLTVAAALTATFTASTGPQLPSSYTATLCTNAAMTANCSTQSVNPGTTTLTSLNSGTGYYISVTANTPSSSYLTASTAVSGPTLASTQLAVPSNVTVGYGTVAGSVSVSFTAPGNAAPSQTYTVVACTNAAMTTGCASNGNFTSGANISGLSYSQGTAGGTYYVTVVANGSTGYFASSTAGPISHADTSQLAAPGTPTGATSTTLAGAIIVTFTSSTGVAPASYTATGCTNSAMTSGCVSGAITSGGALSGLVQGVGYYLRVTANPPSGFVGANSSVSIGTATSSIQLNTPTITQVLPSTTTVGQLTIAFTNSSNAPSGQTYTAMACTDVAMTLGCVTHASYASGSQFAGLTSGTKYYVTITAVASSGYIASTTAATGPTLATVQLTTPSAPVLTYGSTPGSINVTTASSNAPAGQTYLIRACTNSSMTTGCITPVSVTSGSDVGGLVYVQGGAGTSYYVTATANASSGYLGSATSSVAGPQAATSKENAPGQPTAASSTTTAGAITATFTGSSGPLLASYTAIACTNAAMTTGCVTLTSYTSGAQFPGLVQGSSYFVTITALSSSPAYGPATSAVSSSSALATVQLAPPTITAVAPSTTTAGQVTISFTGSANAPGGQTYTATACTNAAMTTGCVSHGSYTSGSQFTGLVAGTSYYATITATAATGYLPVTTAAAGPAMATVQLTSPTGVTLAYGASAGSIQVSYAGSSNAPGGQTYSAKACTNSLMSTGCVTGTIASGGTITGLTYVAGSPGSSYYVTVTAAASSGYLASAPSSVAGPQAATSQLGLPAGFSTSPSATIAGAITATFSAPSGTSPASYTATICTNAAMTTGCSTVTNYASGGQLGGLTPGAGYYVTVTAVSPSSAYASSTTAVSGPTLATSQLATPTGVSLAYGTVAGSVKVTFTGSAGAPGGQTYTAKACTNAAMTAGCVSGAITSGGNLAGLAYVVGSPGSSYYVTVTANASNGFLASSPTSAVGPQADTSQLGVPGTPTVASSTTTAGAVTATFTSVTGTAPTSYSAKACTNVAMTAGCVTVTSFTSGAQLTGLVQGSSYFVEIIAMPPTGYVAGTSAQSSPAVPATTQLSTPVINAITPSTATPGQITILYTGSTNAPAGQIYTATACTNPAMTVGCVTHLNYISGSQFTGLAAGASYDVTITAGASSGYLAATTISFGPVLSTVQLNAPAVLTLAYGATAGSLNVSFTGSSNAPSGQTYTVTACTNSSMTTGCVLSSGFLSSTDLTGLAFPIGAAGSAYYVTITADSSAGYLAATSPVAGPHADTSQLNAPGTPTVASSTTTAGAVTITFTAPSGTAPTSYSATVCANAAMTTGCATQTNYTSGAQFTGLVQGVAYFAQVTALAPTGYVGSVSATSASSAFATTQLATPTGVSLAYGTVAGSVKVTFTGSSNAPGGQAYTATACTNAAMTTGCMTGPIASGGNLTGLAYVAGSPGSSYFVTVTATASSGYLASPPSGVAGAQAATSQLTAPGTPVVASSTTTTGAISATFTSSSGTAPASYTATACTNSLMTAGCVTKTSDVSGSLITGLVAGTAYYVQITAVPPVGYVANTSAVSSPSTLATSQLTAPSISAVAPSTTTAGALTITFTGSSNAPGGQAYTATACTNSAMTTGCVSLANYSSGAQLAGLTQGTGYYATVTAVASSGYLAATSSSAGPATAATQLAAPTGVTVAYGTVAGSVKVTFTGSSNAPGGQAYTAKACTDSSMTTGCVSGAITSGANLTGLVYAVGAAGTSYYVTVTANASSAYLAATSAVAGPQAAMSQLSAPGTPTVTPSATTAGAVTISFSAPSGTAPASYSVTVCTNVAMTTGCTTQSSFTSGSQVTGLAQGTAYFAQVTAVPPAGYLASASAVSSSSIATIQLAAPTGVTLAYGTVAGSVKVTFTGSSNAPGGQAYTATACTNLSMTTGCVTGAITSGANLTGLAFVAGSAGTSYYVTVTATASSGYLASSPSGVAGAQAATSQLNAPGTPTVASSTTTAGGITATFTAPSGTAPASYTAIACSNAAMTTGCVTQASYSSGAQLTGLAQGTAYFVEVTAVPPAGYTANTSAVSASSAAATIQLAAPTGVTLAYGTVAGSVKVTFTGSSNAPGGQAYTATACTNLSMTTGCVTGAITSGANLTGLAFVAGSAGTSYYVTVTATASSGYLASSPSGVAGAQAATSQLNAPGTPAVASSTTTAGGITATFSAPSGTAPASYTATACTNAAMTLGCVVQTSYASGTLIAGLVQGTAYYAQIAAVPPVGYVGSTSATSVSAAPATAQLNAPTINAIAPSTITAGQLTITFTGPSNAPGGQGYTATVCTNAAMTTGCSSQTNYTSAAQVTGLVAGTNYYATITAVASSGFLAMTTGSSGPTMATIQLNAPTVTAVTPSATTAGQVTITYTGSSNAPGGQSYTATACTNAAMTTGCVSHGAFASGSQFTGLTPGTSYYVTITAAAASGYLASTSTAIGPTLATVQLPAPTSVTLASGPVAGSLKVTFTGSAGAPGGQAYTATACTNSSMTTGCVTAGLASGGSITGLAYAQGSAGTSYFVTVTAIASSGYLASAPSSVAGAQAATSQLNAPTITTVAPSTTTAGAITVGFTASSGVAPGSYTATVCTNAGMTTGCVTQTNYTSGAQLTGLTQGASYYVTLTAVPGSSAFLGATTITVGPTMATVQLTTPGTPVLALGSVGGSITVTTSSSNQPAGQLFTVTACTNAAMTTGCVTDSNVASGANATGLAFTLGGAGTSYYVEAAASASSGYLASGTSGVAGPQVDTSQLSPPGTPTVASSTTTTGSLTATFTASTGHAPTSYTATACTDVAMTQNCVSKTSYVSGAQFTGLVAGSSYYVQITAVAPVGWASATSATSSPAAVATLQLATPSTPVLAYGSTAGSLNITSTSANAPGGQTYTVKACTNAGMSTGCVTSSSFTSGADLTGLAFTQGSAGTSYYVTVTANGATGYFASATSSVGGPHADTSRLNAPGTPSVASSTTTGGAVTATFSASTGSAPASYSATACTNSAMTTGCVTQGGYTTGAPLGGLVAGTAYFVQVTAVPPAGYVANTSATSVSSAVASTQLGAASISSVSAGSGSNHGALAVTFSGPSNAPGGQSYTATFCTDAAMTQNCITQGSYTSGTNVTGLTRFTGYYATITAVGSAGYVASTSSAFGPTTTH